MKVSNQKCLQSVSLYPVEQIADDKKKNKDERGWPEISRTPAISAPKIFDNLIYEAGFLYLKRFAKK